MKIAAALCTFAVALGSFTAAASAVSYSYDRSAPLEIATEDTSEDAGIRVDQISFRSDDVLVRASLVIPTQRAAKIPAVLFAHWLGDPATTNRMEFMGDAMWLARRGVMSLVPDEPWSQHGWFEKLRSTQTDARDSRAQVIAMRRSLDALLATPGVDPDRIAFVGHDFGAMYGALLAGADSRVSYAVFMAPTTTLSEWFLLDTDRPPADVPAYVAEMSAFDLSAALSRATFRASLVQFAAHDAYVPAAKAALFAKAVPSADRTIHTYDTDHSLALDAATDDRRDWLADRLGVH